MDRYDLVVIGSGPSGRRAAIQSAKIGKRVLVIEKDPRVGGVSVHTGTMPSKTLRETVLNLSGWRERGFYGQDYRVDSHIDRADLALRVGKTLGHEVDVLQDQFARNDVEVAAGLACFVDAHQISIALSLGGERLVHADRTVIAVGTAPFRPDSIPFNDVDVVDSDTILSAPEIAGSIAVVGAGVIGIEYATILSALDAKVTLIEPRNSFLDFIDGAIIAEFTRQLVERGIDIRLGSGLAGVERDAAGKPVAVLEDGSRISVDMVLYAAGRMGATPGLGLENCGLETDKRGRLAVDPLTFQTSVPHIYATGDVVGFPALASTSLEQGRIAACHAFGIELPPPPAHFPYGIYSVPEISTVGLKEEEVREKGLAYIVGLAPLAETSRGHIMGLDSGLLKMIFARDSERLLGVHIVGEGATELIHIGQAVLNLGGGLDFFMENTFNYPTLAEAYKTAALDAWNILQDLAAA
ncbi:MAG: Si-specific NAD(P)(+) transhydrogenase [Polymorphobacter sp.]